jgi:hypothetical protein
MVKKEDIWVFMDWVTLFGGLSKVREHRLKTG